MIERNRKPAILFILAFTLTNFTNITICNAIEVIQQDNEEYLVFEPNGPNEKKVKILGEYVFSQGKSWALMMNPEVNDGNYLRQVQIFDETGNITGTFMRYSAKPMYIANNGRILLHGQEPYDLNSPSGFWIYNEKGEVLFDSGHKFREVGIGCFSNDGEKFVLTFNVPPSESDYTKTGIPASKEFPGIILLYNSDFTLINSSSFDYLSPISVEFSTDDSRIFLSLIDCINWKECRNSESYIIRTITYDNELNEISEKQKPWKN